MNHLKLIKTEQDHEEALSHLVTLLDMNPASNTPESDDIDVLAVLIEKYEQEKFPIEQPDPVEAIKFRMEQEGLINKDLASYIGSESKVSEVLNGKRNLSLNMIRRLSVGLGISAEILIQAPEQKKASSQSIDWVRFPIAEMRKRGYFEGFSGTLSELKEYLPEKITAFLASVPSGFNLQSALLRTSAHLYSNDKITDEYALWAWQVRVLQRAQNQTLKGSYVKGTVSLSWMQDLARLSWSDQGPQLAAEFLSQHGIHLVIEKHLPKTYLDGAVCVTDDGNPVVALTLRFDRLDSFWFSLMHELAHIALHLDGNQSWYLDILGAPICDEVEQEADELAKEALIAKSVWENRGVLNADKVRKLSKELSISTCIVAGRERFETKNYQLFGKLFNEKVKQHFD